MPAGAASGPGLAAGVICLSVCVWGFARTVTAGRGLDIPDGFACTILPPAEPESVKYP